MTLSLKTNIGSLKAQRQLLVTSNQLSTSLERLSSGQRINKASDNSAGLAIAESLRADTKVALQGIRNLNDGISALNIYEGALSELSNIVTRQTELANQSANGVITTAQRQALEAEANALSKEFNRIVSTTKFNGISLGGEVGRAFSMQAGSGSPINFNIANDLSRIVGNGTFATGITTSTSPVGNDYITGDINGDGIADLVNLVSESYSGKTVIFLGRGDGTFQSGVTSNFSLNEPGFTLGDFNGDGKDDLVVYSTSSSTSGSNTISVFLSNGNGTFSAGYSSPMPLQTFSGNAGVGDFNGDGHVDFISPIDTTGSRRYIYYGNGSGTSFTSVSFIETTSGLNGRPTIQDVNGDGIDDLLELNSSNTVIRLGSASGLGAAITSSITAGYSFWHSFGDYNDDGKADFVAFDATGIMNIRMGNGDGTFTLTQSTAGVAPGSSTSFSKDFNGDGIIDIGVVATSGGNKYASILYGNGDGSFTASGISTALTTGGSSFIAEDFNGDDVLDIFAAGPASPDFLHLGNTKQATYTRLLDFSSQESSSEELEFLSQSLIRVSKELGSVGAVRSRLEVATSNLYTAAENFKAAESRIRDADVAQETAEMLRLSILRQSGVAVLAQANLQPELALSLIQGSTSKKDSS